jgi:hypothetical protein
MTIFLTVDLVVILTLTVVFKLKTSFLGYEKQVIFNMMLLGGRPRCQTKNQQLASAAAVGSSCQ